MLTNTWIVFFSFILWKHKKFRKVGIKVNLRFRQIFFLQEKWFVIVYLTRVSACIFTSLWHKVINNKCIQKCNQSDIYDLWNILLMVHTIIHLQSTQLRVQIHFSKTETIIWHFEMVFDIWRLKVDSN